MSRSRTYVFIIEKSTEPDWEYVCNLEKNGKCEYISACKYKGKINGFIRFMNSKFFNSVQKLLSNATIEIVKNNDLYYKEKFSKNEYFFESGKHANKKHINSNNKELIKLLEEKDTIINQQKEQLLEEKEKLVMIYKEQIAELIDTFKSSKENDSEQIKQITNICMTIAKNTPTIISNANNNNTTNNTKFNLNFFLNEHCKNAINLVDFAKSIQIKLEDLMLYKKLGHVEAVSKIFDTAYKNLDLKLRPMHCTDVKRETLYVRNEDKWINDESKEFSEKAIDIISTNSYLQLKKWKDANPDYMTSEAKIQEYTVLVKQLIGGSSDNELDDNVKKILRNISKYTLIEKETNE